MTRPLLLLTILAGQSTASAGEPSPVTVWLDRPWEVRYILFVSDQSMFTHHISYTRKANAQALAHHEHYYLDGAALLRPRRFFGMPALATALILFDSTGVVRQGDIGPQNWIGKRNLLDKVVLIGNTASKSAPYYLVDWDQGIPGDQ